MRNECRVKICVSLLLLSLSCRSIADQSHYVLDPEESGARLQAGLSSPAAYLGSAIGERAIRHGEAMAYFRYLGENTDRAQFDVYGATPAGRELFRLVISSPENLERLAGIKSDLRELGGGNGRTAALIESSPAVVWMGYGIHGNELASSDAAVMVAFRLVAGEDEEIRQIRENLVVYVDPMYNPDGRARATGHVDIFRRSTASVDPQDMVHNEFWANGRGNHYFFDLNRDVIFQVQTQSRQRVRAISDASPQLYVASHETEWSDTYLFAVPAEPLNPFLPKQVHDSWADFSKDHSAAFDERGISYYTRAWNEVFYPGYYDIWPAYFGAVPILYEQAATSGLSVRIPTQQILTFHTAVSNHFRSSMANLLTAAANRSTLLRRWADVRRDAGNDDSHTVSWIILPDNAYKASETLRILKSLGIEVDVLTERTSVRGLHGYWNDAPQAVELPPGTLKVDLKQPLSRLVHNIFDYHVAMSNDFVATEKRNLDLGHDTQIYDVTAWSLPLAFNAPVYWSESGVRGAWQSAGDTVAGGGGTLESVPRYGYIYTDDSLHATARLLAQGLKIRASDEPFVHRGVLHSAGTFLVRGGEQSIDALSALNAEAAAGQIRLVAAQSARITEGGPDLGGDDFTLLQQPMIAILGNRGVSESNFGAIWHLLDETIGVPVTLLNIENLADFDLSRYSVLIMPEVDDDAASSSLLGSTEPLDRWIEMGGTLITVGQSSLLLAGQGIGGLITRADALETHPPQMIGRTAHEMMADNFQGLLAAGTQAPDVVPPVIGDAARPFVPDNFRSFDVAAKTRSFEDWAADVVAPDEDKLRLASGMRRYLPKGAYLRVELKPKHWLAYGVGERVPALFREGDVLLPGDDTELVARYAGPGNLMMSGLVWPESIGYITGTVYLALQRRGRGQVIAFANDPVFRGYSLGTARLFLNAVVLGGGYR